MNTQANTTASAEHTLEQQLESIVDHKHVYAVTLWPYFGQGYLGALLDQRLQQIPGSVLDEVSSDPTTVLPQ